LYYTLRYSAHKPKLIKKEHCLRHMIAWMPILIGAALLAGWARAASDPIIFTFNKEPHGTWYIDLPDYPGPKGNLAMVAGADDMLDFLAKGKSRVVVAMSEQPFNGALALHRVKVGEPGGGAYYKPDNHVIQSVWLCDVTLFALGKFPEHIYFRAVE
jgi:hypothetical protein